MNKSGKEIKPKNLAMVLGAVILITGMAILILAFIPKSTVVEISAITDRASFTILPPQLLDIGTSLLDNSLKVKSLQWKGVDKMEATTLEESTLKIIKFQPDTEDKICLESNEPFRVSIDLYEKAHILIQPFDRDKLKITLKQENSENAGWESTVEYNNLEMKLKGIKNPADIESHLTRHDILKFTSGHPLVIKGGQRETELGLHLFSPERQFSGILEVIDSRSGQIVETKDLPVAISESYVVLLKDRVVVLKKGSNQETSVNLFRPDINIQQPEFYRLSGSQEESFLIGGQVRFPAKERENVELERDFLLEVPNSTPLKLKSFQLIDKHLQLVLWGKPSSVLLGPTPDLMAELLPSYFVWLYTHKLSTVVFSTIGGVVTTCIAGLKLFKWLKL